MIKKLPLTFISTLAFMLIFSGCMVKPDKHNRALTLKDMIALSSMSHQQAIDYLVKDRKSILVANRTVYRQQITEFSWQKGDSSTDIIKSQWQEGNQLFHSIHCDIFPVSYQKQILAQLRDEGFHLVEKYKGEQMTSLLYAKGLYTISVYRYAEKSLPLSVELHKLF